MVYTQSSNLYETINKWGDGIVELNPVLYVAVICVFTHVIW